MSLKNTILKMRSKNILTKMFLSNIIMTIQVMCDSNTKPNTTSSGLEPRYMRNKKDENPSSSSNIATYKVV